MLFRSKMSKSYGNTIALFAPPAQLQKQIASIVTDSRAPGEPKSTENSALFQIYQAFASVEETDALRASYAQGIAWGDAKQLLFERIDREVAPMRDRYESLVNDPGRIEQILLSGAAKARAFSKPFTASLRHAVGLRNLAVQPVKTVVAKPVKVTQGFKQYRERDGLFYFKLNDAKGHTLVQSHGFKSPQDAGQAIDLLRSNGESGLVSLASRIDPLTDDAVQKVLLVLEQLNT